MHYFFIDLKAHDNIRLHTSYVFSPVPCVTLNGQFFRCLGNILEIISLGCVLDVFHCNIKRYEIHWVSHMAKLHTFSPFVVVASIYHS